MGELPKPLQSPVTFLPPEDTSNCPKVGCAVEKPGQPAASTYLSDVHKALGTTSYSQFIAALRAYKQDDDLDKVLAVVAALTTEKPEHLPLLQRFGMFVRRHHKPQFLQTCADLMGLPTTGKSLELPDHREESTTLPSELTHEDTKPGEGSLEDSLHPCPVTLSPLTAPGSQQEGNTYAYTDCYLQAPQCPRNLRRLRVRSHPSLDRRQSRV